MQNTSELTRLHQDIEQCVQNIRQQQPDWLCGKGCATCCKRLAEIPELTEQEWKLLSQGLAMLTPSHLNEIRDRIGRLANQTTRPVVCPMLDQASGACPVYAQRPVACRTYGFYVQRELGLYCHEIETRVAEGQLADVVWGNHDVIDRQLSRQGKSRPLTAWFAESPFAAAAIATD